MSETLVTKYVYLRIFSKSYYVLLPNKENKQEYGGYNIIGYVVTEQVFDLYIISTH